MDTFDLLLILIASVFGLYEIFIGFWSFRSNGYHFYWIANLLIGLPFLLAAGLTYLRPSFRSPLLEGSVILIWISGEAWKLWMKRRAERQDPARWQRWVEMQEEKSRQ